MQGFVLCPSVHFSVMIIAFKCILFLPRLNVLKTMLRFHRTFFFLHKCNDTFITLIDLIHYHNLDYSGGAARSKVSERKYASVFQPRPVRVAWAWPALAALRHAPPRAATPPPTAKSASPKYDSRRMAPGLGQAGHEALCKFRVGLPVSVRLPVRLFARLSRNLRGPNGLARGSGSRLGAGRQRPRGSGCFMVLLLRFGPGVRPGVRQ